MRANCWMGKNDVRVEQVPDPQILNQSDAIVRITSTAICGSDLHLYNGFVPTMESGDVLGHEFMGEVVETGKAVKNLKKGDRVVVPFPIACGACFSCQKGLFSLCENSNRTPGWRRNSGDTRLAESSGIHTCWADTQAARPSMRGCHSPMSDPSKCRKGSRTSRFCSYRIFSRRGIWARKCAISSPAIRSRFGDADRLDSSR